MPLSFVSLADQLNTKIIREAVDNYLPVRQVNKFDLRVNGTTPDVQEFTQWADFDGTPNPSSPVKSVSVIEFVGIVADAALNVTEFLGAAGLTNGITIGVRKNGFVTTLATIKTVADLFDFFDEVTITPDNETPPNNVIKARMLFAEQDGLFLNLVDETSGDEDAIIFTVSDNLAAVGVSISGNVYGYAFVARRGTT